MGKASRTKRERRATSPHRRGGRGTIFCDEAGFTGNNLLDAGQEVFVFAAVAIPPEQAQEICERTARDFKLQSGGELLKGSRMLKTDNGRKAISSVVARCAAHTSMVSHLKKYALAAKIFEYIFEPVLADQNSIFYGVGFHLFIANLLFGFFRARDAAAEDIFSEFSKFAREGDTNALQRLFPSAEMIVDSSNPMHAIGLFALTHRKTIIEELAHVHRDSTTPNWVLDLTSTSLFTVLALWGQVYDELDVYCDRSKPLESETEIFKAMVGRTDRVTLKMFGKTRPYSFNLVRLPELVESKVHPGIQIADVMASAAGRAWQSRYRGQLDATERGWLRDTEQCFVHDNIWPDLKHADPTSLSGFVNAMLLTELTERSVSNQDLFSGIPEFISAAHELYATRRRSRQLKHIPTGADKALEPAP